MRLIADIATILAIVFLISMCSLAGGLPSGPGYEGVRNESR